MEPQVRKRLDAAWKSAARERGRRRTQALEAWLQDAGDDGVTYLASVAFGGGAASHRKAALGQLSSLDWGGRTQAGEVGAVALERGSKASLALYETILRAGGQGRHVGAAIRERMGWIGAADALKMVGRTDDSAVLSALSQHWSRPASRAALALSGGASDPWRGCPLSEDARRALAFAGVRTAPPPEAPRAGVPWLVASARWPEGDYWHNRLDQDATWAYEGQVDIESDGRSYACFAWVALHQYYFAFSSSDTSPDPAVYEVDHDATVRGVGWSRLSMMFDRMRFGRRG